MFHRNSLNYSNDQSYYRLHLSFFRLKLCGERTTGLHRITRHYSAELQTMQTLTTSKYSMELTYSDFSCHFKMNRDKLALINSPWKCKKGERLTITAGSLRRIDQHDNFTCAALRTISLYLHATRTKQLLPALTIVNVRIVSNQNILVSSKTFPEN